MSDFEPGRQNDDEYAICPHCGAQHGDCWEWVTDRQTERDCQECGKPFMVYAEYSVEYITNIPQPPQEG